ncbi:sugar ABC transporter substrate-binding protein [Bacillus canaveralius]|uniref:Sugar ABC transporter substrate-binding protein n=1 Tax=Bacillus canaveralius TaxID=1403243 RepID=A0A2N5GS55_9BACI|nr:sugar ABC transporter substrate-binding protein [Bacillus canaveralius]PLR86377.1 sugar ABC transporter substrate-binding protein [Bacillus canaveralius]PLR98610.1 sugar ABC transporter substrate-binding protein [Bacillus canaveralius]
MKKVVSLFAVLIVFIGLIAGCSNGGTKEGSAEAEKQGGSNEKVDLKMAVFPADQEVFESAYENFKKDHPNIEITFETFPQEQYYEKLRMQLSSGEGYDLFTGQMDNMIDTGLLAPLDDYIQESKMDVSGYGTMYEAYKVDGKVMTLPYRKSNWMLYYNKTLFDEKGIDYPSDDMTWNEFRELAKEMSSGSGNNKIYGAYLQQWPQTWYMSAVQGGASIIDKDLTPFKDALQLRVDLEEDGSIMKWSEQVSTGAHYNTAFQKGNIAMNIIGDWHVAQLRQAEKEGTLKFDWNVAPIPRPEGVAKNTSLALPVSIMMNKNTEHPKEAFEFLKYMTGKDGAKLLASEGYLTGYMDEDIEKAYLGDGSQKPKNLHYFLETKDYPEYPMIPGVNNIVVGQIFKQEGELVLIGQKSVDDAIKEITKRVQSEWASKYGDQQK